MFVTVLTLMYVNCSLATTQTEDFLRGGKTEAIFHLKLVFFFRFSTGQRFSVSFLNFVFIISLPQSQLDLNLQLIKSFLFDWLRVL